MRNKDHVELDRRHMRYADRARVDLRQDTDQHDTVRECLLCGTRAPEWVLVRNMCPHALEVV
jgi:hypothetical protein